ncbi:MAG: PQQ-binding-like beta-propeller repeat protein [Planctomycetota bacterium]
MRDSLTITIPAALAALAGAAALAWWLERDPMSGIVARLPGADGAGFSRVTDVPVTIGEFSRNFGGSPAKSGGDWPGFRGPDSTNVAPAAIRLAGRWNEKDPPVLWSVSLGEGHAGPAVWQGRVFVLDYDEANQRDILRCLSLADGKELWQRGYRVHIKRNHGRSRTVPAVAEGFVVTIGPRGHVMAVDPVTGDYLWGKDLVREFGTKIPEWYAGQCPLIDGKDVVLAPAGKDVLLMGVDGRTGIINWKTPNPRGWPMSHASVMPMTMNGKKSHIYCAIGGVAGISAEPGDKGALLWETDAWKPSVEVPSPVPLGDGRILVTAGYGVGSALLQITEDGGKFSVRVIQSWKSGDGFSSEQQTPVFYKGHLYAVLPKDAGPFKGQFVCAAPDDGRKFAWTSGKDKRFGLGPYLVADGKLFVLDETGVIVMVKASPEGYTELGRAKVLDGPDAWGPMALSGTRLILRDTRRMICVDVGENPEKTP